MNLKNIYQDIILNYNKRSDLKYDMKEATHIERGHNPNCGDDLTLLLQAEDGIIKAASFLGVGCAISTASTCMLIDLIKGKKMDEVKNILNTFFKMMKGEKLNAQEEDILGDAAILGFAYNMPVRIKCATLSWHSLKVIIEKTEKR